MREREIHLLINIIASSFGQQKNNKLYYLNTTTTIIKQYLYGRN